MHTLLMVPYKFHSTIYVTSDKIHIFVGIDIDWEYPNSPGAGQPYSPSDSTNLLLFLQSLRTKLGSSKIISAAVTQLPWLGSNGRPLTNVSAYAKEMDYVNIMYPFFSSNKDAIELPLAGITMSTGPRRILVQTLRSAIPVAPTLSPVPLPKLPSSNGRPPGSQQQNFCWVSHFTDTFPRVQRQPCLGATWSHK
jgi:Glycosyl hydrolases family 18